MRTTVQMLNILDLLGWSSFITAFFDFRKPSGVHSMKRTMFVHYMFCRFDILVEPEIQFFLSIHIFGLVTRESRTTVVLTAPDSLAFCVNLLTPHMVLGCSLNAISLAGGVTVTSFFSHKICDLFL